MIVRTIVMLLPYLGRTGRLPDHYKPQPAPRWRIVRRIVETRCYTGTVETRVRVPAKSLIRSGQLVLLWPLLLMLWAQAADEKAPQKKPEAPARDDRVSITPRPKPGDKDA